MAEEYVIEKATLTAIADSIRAKKGTTADIVPENMPTEIASIEGGGGEDHLDDFLTNTLTAINSDVTTVNTYGSYGRTALKTVNLPKCTKVGSYAFRGCSDITSVNAPLLTTADTYSFYGCSKLAEFDMSKLTTIGNYAFYKCDLRNVDAPLATGVSQNAFYQNENLVIADFGKANRINQAGLANCGSLVTLILRLTSGICALATATNALQGTPIAEGTGYVYVPALIEEYKTATNWVNYASQFRPLVATVADLASIDGSVYDRAWVDDEYCVYLYNGSSWAKEA